MHARCVDAIHELLRDGECYQVNLTRRIEFDCIPDALGVFSTLARRNPAPYAQVCSFGDALAGVAIVSASPELFLRVDDRRVETRPIKGTGTDAPALAASTKDLAENVMIVDLARNDLGRVCEYGSVRVPSLFRLEAHPGLHHLVSTVVGRLRAGVSLGELVRATFPPASVTGAPKPRVLQAIEDLEPVRRGVYCGAVGWIDGDRDAVRSSRWRSGPSRSRAGTRRSESAAASSPTRRRTTSGPRPSSRPRACSDAAGGYEVAGAPAVGAKSG